MPSVISGDANVSATEFGYLDGVTSAIQTQLGGKADTTGNGAWTSWTPTAFNYTVGNGTLSSKYVQIGKLVGFRFNFTLGSTSAISGDFGFTFPVAGASLNSFSAVMVDAGVNVYLAFATWTGVISELCYVRAVGTASTYGSFATTSATVPFTWGSGDIIICSGIYEAA